MLISDRFASPPVMIYVGPNEESFSVPADLLKSSSQYFLAMLTKGWIEAQEGMVFLTDIDPADFNQYVEYLYSGKIAATPAERTEVCYMAEYERLIHCYALGDRFEDAGFRDAIIDRIIENSKVYVPDKDDPEDEAKTYPFGPVVELAYSFGSSKSPLRRLIVDQHVTHGVAGWIDEHKLELYNKEFLYDLSIALFKNRPAPSKLKGPAAAASTCDYHEHQRSGKRCYKTAS